MIQLWNKFKDIDRNNIENVVLDDGPNGYLVASRSDQGAYILLPKKGNYNEIKQLISNPFDKNPKTETIQTDSQKEDSTDNSTLMAPKNSQVERDFSESSLEILNGTRISGLAAETSQNLKQYGFNINRISNSPQVNNEQTKIYDLSFGEKKEALNLLETELQASSSISLPDWLTDYIKNSVETNTDIKKPDFIIVLGLK